MFKLSISGCPNGHPYVITEVSLFLNQKKRVICILCFVSVSVSSFYSSKVFQKSDIILCLNNLRCIKKNEFCPAFVICKCAQYAVCQHLPEFVFPLKINITITISGLSPTTIAVGFVNRSRKQKGGFKMVFGLSETPKTKMLGAFIFCIQHYLCPR